MNRSPVSLGHLAAALPAAIAVGTPGPGVLITGGREFEEDNCAAVDIWHERNGLVASWRSRLDGPLPAAVPGTPMTIEGHGLTGVSEASGGTNAAAMATPGSAAATSLRLTAYPAAAPDARRRATMHCRTVQWRPALNASAR